MDFVNNIDFKASLVGREIDLIAEVTDVFNAGVGSGIDLDQVEKAALVDRQAVIALITRTGAEVLFQAVDRLGKDAGDRGFTGAARPGEQIGMPLLTGSNRVAQGDHNVLLADDLVPGLGTPFTIICLSHRIFLGWCG